MRSNGLPSTPLLLIRMASTSSGMTQNLVSTSCLSLGKSTRVRSQSWARNHEADFIKAGGKGRAAFCQSPPVDKDKRKGTDYSEFPLTPHGEMILSLIQSNIASFPNRSVALQFYETVSRYADFFKVRRECIIPTLQSMIDARYVPFFRLSALLLY